MKYLLDTSTCVYLLRGRLDLTVILGKWERQSCAISEITVAELRFGAENSLSPDTKHMALDHFIGGLTVLPIFSAIMTYARQKVQLRKIGKPLHDEFDLMIAATALQNGLMLVTDNEKDFVNISGLKVVNWYRKY